MRADEEAARPLFGAFRGRDLPLRRLRHRGDPARLAGSRLVACIPARNEEKRIDRCLRALDGELRPGDGVVLVANDCADGTVAIASTRFAGWSRPWLLLDCCWRETGGSAPLARRLALDIASRFAPDADLLSIDADTVVLAGLRDAYASEFARGFDLVCGRIGFLPDEAASLPPADPANERAIREYREASRHIGALLDPDPDNPWPHHGNIGGANFAVRGVAYRRAGPLPTPPSGEDRALRRRFEALGMRIRYSDLPRVETSPRLIGRAPGGLSEELRRNRTEADPLVDELLEPPDRLLLRCRSKTGFLGAQSVDERREALRALRLTPPDAERLAAASGGLAWQEAEELSPLLRRQRLRLSDLHRLLPELRAALASIPATRCDNPA